MTPGKTILVVDDELDFLNLVAGALEPQGYKVLIAHGGHEALQLFDSHPTPIDLLLTDVTMPGMDGVALSEQVKQKHPSVRIAFMSGGAAPDLIGRAQPLFRKPLELDSLAKQLDALLKTD